MNEELISQIDALRTDYQDNEDQELIDSWLKSLKEANQTVKILEKEEMSKLLIKLAEKVRNNKCKLADDRTLTEEDRLRIFAENDCFNWLIDYFVNPFKYIKNLEQEINRIYEERKEV